MQSYEKTHNCDVCGTPFGRKDALAKLKKTHESGKQNESSDPPPPPPAKKQRIAEHFECNICSASFENVQELKDHLLIYQEENKEDEEEYPGQEVPLIEKALANALRIITFKPEGVQKNDFLQFFSYKKKEMLLNILRMKLREPMQ